MNTFVYKQFYDKVGQRNGWDFSKLNVITEGALWEFEQEVAARCTKSDLLLDIGTGGGERLLSLADAALLLVGIDHSFPMIRAANANLEKAKKPNVRFLHMDAENLRFPSGFFQIAACRQSHFDAGQVANVLAQGGIFLTQQVGERDKNNLTQAFGRGQHGGNGDGVLKDRYVSELAEAGFTDIRSFEYDAAEYYESFEDLVFLLKHTPIIPDFGENDDDFDILHHFIEEHQTDKGIKTNSHRFMITAVLSSG
ncbi:class I SAM-dependent methyltransferase [Paenibacillus mesophilus]|uniref:class I SAM-dependent methyltransferase n=1 Tax=Paenibacillus mesophilus TaxID=2582849 RepID=UPI00110F5155|nr:class I SAM-dependent methyltransferase [Paenibacillus mesophilus]TMV52243.1 class I SAM-dependent methyltransferase [Paenibacillus mesophilus]